MKVRCLDVFRERRCSLPFGHDGLHRNGDHTWGFRDDRPEWRRRSEALYRSRGLVAAKEIGR